MENNVDYDFIGGTDLFDDQLDETPDIHSLQTTGTNKLLVVVFIVDCSRSMEGDRIMAVNAALPEVKSILQNIKRDNHLDLRLAIMSFASSAKWELQLTDIDEVSLENLKTRPGLTEYGNAFRKLNKALQTDQFMNYTGRIAAPAIMFLTDGAPTDDYESDLEDLLRNEWFANASRSAVLVGEAIYDDVARNAVRRFVENPDSDIVDAENSTVIIQKIKTGTLHVVDGKQADNGNAYSENDVVPSDDQVEPSETDKVVFGDNPVGTDKYDPTDVTGSTDKYDPFDITDPFNDSCDIL